MIPPLLAAKSKTAELELPPLLANRFPFEEVRRALGSILGGMRRK